MTRRRSTGKAYKYGYNRATERISADGVSRPQDGGTEGGIPQMAAQRAEKGRLEGPRGVLRQVQRQCERHSRRPGQGGCVPLRPLRHRLPDAAAQFCLPHQRPRPCDVPPCRRAAADCGGICSLAGGVLSAEPAGADAAAVSDSGPDGVVVQRLRSGQPEQCQQQFLRRADAAGRCGRRRL